MISAWKRVQACTTLEFEFLLLRNLHETDYTSINFARPEKRQRLNHPTETLFQPSAHGRLSWKRIPAENKLTTQNYKTHKDTLSSECLP